MLVYLRIEASQGKTQIKGMDTQKFIHIVKLHILLQMKPYSRVKYNWELSYTCISIFVELGQLKEIGPKCHKSWALIHRKLSKVLSSTFQMKPYTNTNSIEGWFTPVLVYLGNWGKLGRFIPNSPFIGINAQKDIHSVKLHISHQMKPYLIVKAIWGSINTCFVQLRHWGKLAKFNPITSNHGHVKFQVSHQMKPNSKVKATCGLSYIYCSIFGELGQVRQIGPKYPTSLTLIHRKSFKVLNSTFHSKWSWQSEGWVKLV